MTFKGFKNKIFRKINKTKEMFIIDYEDTQQKDKFFSDIHLYDDLKQPLSKTLVSKESLNCVLVGPPASGKTMFLLSIQKNMKDVFFIDATNASGAGIVDKLFAHPRTKIILIDEIESDALQLAKLVRNSDDVDKMARTIMRYKPKIINPSSASKLK